MYRNPMYRNPTYRVASLKAAHGWRGRSGARVPLHRGVAEIRCGISEADAGSADSAADTKTKRLGMIGDGLSSVHAGR